MPTDKAIKLLKATHREPFGTWTLPDELHC